LLELAAIAGRRFNVDLLEALLGMEGALAGLKELIRAGLIVDESAELFTFRDALTREAVLQGLLLRERRALHRRVAETLERLYAGDPVWQDEHAGDLAYHHAEGESWLRAFEYARRAGERAVALGIQHHSQPCRIAVWRLVLGLTSAAGDRPLDTSSHVVDSKVQVHLHALGPRVRLARPAAQSVRRTESRSSCCCRPAAAGPSPRPAVRQAEGGTPP
jgi:hypothetical protein